MWLLGGNQVGIVNGKNHEKVRMSQKSLEKKVCDTHTKKKNI